MRKLYRFCIPENGFGIGIGQSDFSGVQRRRLFVIQVRSYAHCTGIINKLIVQFERLADYKKGGELINVYNNGGQDEAEKFIVEKLPGLMYNYGKGQVINRNDYLRWKFQNRKHVRKKNLYIILRA